MTGLEEGVSFADKCISLLARDPPRMEAAERKCKSRTVGQKMRWRRNFIGFARDKAAGERSTLAACQATRIPARHPVCRSFVPGNNTYLPRSR